MCPRCGNPVGIPSLQPTNPGSLLGPMTLEERLKARRQSKPTELTSGKGTPGEPSMGAMPTPPPRLPAKHNCHTGGVGMPPNPSAPQSQPVAIVAPFFRTSLVRLTFSRKERSNRRRGLETHWCQCLLFPLRALTLIFALAVALTVMTGIAFVLVSERGGLAAELTWDSLARLLWLAIPVLIVGYTCGFLDCTLASAAVGEMPMVRWPGRNVSLALRSLVTWVACFLAGPIVPAGILFLYWSQCGDPELVDWLIWAELVVVGIGYWLLAIVAVSLRDRLRDANPVQIIVLVRRVGFRLLIAALVAALVFLGYGVLALNAIELLHKEVSGLLFLAGYWFSALFLAAFLFRLLGVWCYQHRVSLESEKNV
jgi:hypothetical protein